MEELLTTEQAAEWLQLSVWSIYRLVREEGLPAIKVGSLRFRQSDLDAWLNSRMKVAMPG